jgi:aerobic-type carbon monoxide dehydrogenase small subunit (CoxS/CutS family)
MDPAQTDESNRFTLTPMPNVSELHVNGTARRIAAGPDRTLLSVLRDDLGLTGAKYGCGEGQCGACTVLIDGTPVRACLQKIGKVGAKQVTTIESLEQDGKLHPVQEAFLETDALQCGYCTPGMILSAVALLKLNPRPGKQEIVRAMDGNICRCGIYPRIVAAIQRASKKMEEAR